MGVVVLPEVGEVEGPELAECAAAPPLLPRGPRSSTVQRHLQQQRGHKDAGNGEKHATLTRRAGCRAAHAGRDRRRRLGPRTCNLTGEPLPRANHAGGRAGGRGGRGVRVWAPGPAYPNTGAHAPATARDQALRVGGSSDPRDEPAVSQTKRHCAAFSNGSNERNRPYREPSYALCTLEVEMNVLSAESWARPPLNVRVK